MFFVTRQLVDADSPELLAADEDDDGQRSKPVVAPVPKSQLRGKRVRTVGTLHSDDDDAISSLMSSRSAVSNLSRLSSDQLMRRLEKTPEEKRNCQG